MAAANQRLGEYILIDRIGGGAFGEVWRARHHAWAEQIVAIKIPADARFVRYLQKEGAAVGLLVHACIVRAIAFDPYHDPAYLVMEFVQGPNLRQLIKNGPMPVADAVGIIKQVLSALHQAHARGIVHRDVKPENILIDEKLARSGFGKAGCVKLSDFGLGSMAVHDPKSIVISGESEKATIVGSAAYMSPEQREGGAVDARSDLYACGVVLFEMLTGRRPAGTESPGELREDVPAAIDEVFRKAYAREEVRFASAEEFFNALTLAMKDQRRSRPGRRGRLVLGLVMAAVAVAAVVVWLWPMMFRHSVWVQTEAPRPMVGQSSAEAPTATALPPFDGSPRELINGMTGKCTSFEGGVYQLQEGDRISTGEKFKPPVAFRVVAQTNSTNLRFGYAADQIIFNWEGRLDQLRIDGGPAGGRNKDGAGSIPANTWVTFDLVVRKDSMSIAVDGEPRYSTRADFSKVNQPLSVFQGSLATVEVKSILVGLPN
jgi:serine/threonine protein kinase